MTMEEIRKAAKEREEIRKNWVQWPQDIDGKTVKKTVEEYGVIGFLFTDGTYTVIGAEGGGCDEDPSVNLEVPDMDMLGMLGVLSKEEYDAYKQGERSKVKEALRRKYEELKKEFENSDNNPK